ncbi:lipopolysaccharide biosynthesis protein [Aeromonas sp. 3925]|uniref:hypothetical protein n=1 Tax=Aeromonas genomosp. paramedia TaxID=3086176 RepID=UPI001FFD47E1|nr:hypothetical protein [Aeromonas genomosp. paramedia]MCK2084366.1 lipopolysaccharide biosynthesis protein [Aeromonas genomosp. paramedia]
MNDLAGKKVLFICPRFFGYEYEIKSGLAKLGAQVDYYDERPFNSSIAKILNRLNFKTVIKKSISDYYFDILQNAVAVDYDYLLVVAPETITADFINGLKLNNTRIKTVLYLWDSIKNKKNASDLIEYFDKVVTFDKVDALMDSRISFLPLFYVDAYAKSVNEPKDCPYQFSFIGTAHSGRYNLVTTIADSLGMKKVSNYLFFYSPSRLLFILKKIFTNELNGISLRDISFKSMTSEEIISVLADTKVVIDIEHPNQNGLTMRTIEMVGMQKKLITTNRNVMEYDFYNPNNILVVDRENPHIDISFMHSEYHDIDDAIREKYSLSSWLINLLSLK